MTINIALSAEQLNHGEHTHCLSCGMLPPPDAHENQPDAATLYFRCCGKLWKAVGHLRVSIEDVLEGPVRR